MERVISAAGHTEPQDKDMVAPVSDSTRSGLRNKWTREVLPPCGESLRPAEWAEGGSPHSLTYSRISSYASSPAGLTILPYYPYSPTVPPPFSGPTPALADSPAPHREPGSSRPVRARSTRRYQRRRVVHAGDGGHWGRQRRDSVCPHTAISRPLRAQGRVGLRLCSRRKTL